MGLLKRERLLESSVDKELRVRDRVVILEHDGRLAEVLDVEDINEDRVLAPGYLIPIKDAKEYISPSGRVFVVNAPKEYIQETKHLATVEMATVIRHAVQYERMVPEKTDIGKLMPWIIVVILLLAVIFKK